MLRAVICLGDPTSHGGKVLEGSEKFSFHGSRVARIGHKTYCPQCKGDFPFVEGVEFHAFLGAGTAVEGMKTGCGAELIATVTKGAFEIDDRRRDQTVAGTTRQVLQSDAHIHQASAQFKAIDEVSDHPIKGIPYRLELPDGSSRTGVTDADGLTERVVGQESSQVHLFWLCHDQGSHPVEHVSDGGDPHEC
jgi:uncharacterized Zn-binding protein involved in type VI secretion